MSKKSASRISARVLKSVSILAVGTALAGCASDTVRFSDGFYTGAVPKQAVGPAQTPFPAAQAPQPTYQQPTYRQPTYSSAPVYAPANNAGIDPTYTASVPKTPSVARQPLAAPKVAAPKVVAPVAAAPKAVVPPVPAVRQVEAPAPIKPAPVAKPVAAKEGWTATGGTYVTMREGETVYNLAKRYGVPANAIMEANGIRDAKSVAAGAKVIIPTYVYSRTTPVSAPDANAATRAASSNLGSRSRVALGAAPLPTLRPVGTQVASLAPIAAVAPKVAAKAAAGAAVNRITNGKYSVTSGDTLSGIAARSGASIAAIKRLNGLSSDNLRIGQALLIPGLGGNPAAPIQAAVAATVDPLTTNKPAQVKSYTPPVVSASTKGSIQKIETTSNATAPANTGVSKMRWPVQGRVISGFGSNVGGKGNDGIDISVPNGTPVKAAENGVVIYAGDGLKEFGNTVLVRHGSGLVTVYGHLSSINVSRGANVSRGQTLGSSGMSGSAKQPQLHFEVRKNTTPVNPTSYL